MKWSLVMREYPGEVTEFLSKHIDWNARESALVRIVYADGQFWIFFPDKVGIGGLEAAP